VQLIVLRLTDPIEPQIVEAVAVVRRGGVVAFPTDTLYGLAADPRSQDAVSRIFALKGRTLDRTLALVACDLVQVDEVGMLTSVARRAASQFWPGPLTILLQARPGLAPAIVGEGGLVGVRIPDHPVALALTRACGHALTATSANRSGEPATAEPEKVAIQLPNLDLLLDAGLAPGGPPSTIVDLSGEPPRLVRAGATPWERVLESFRPASSSSAT
jgi:L-threonylcarbamoyladenylate synthase